MEQQWRTPTPIIIFDVCPLEEEEQEHTNKDGDQRRGGVPVGLSEWCTHSRYSKAWKLSLPAASSTCARGGLRFKKRNLGCEQITISYF